MTHLVASVWLHEQRVGELHQDDQGYIEFQPDPRWIEDSERPVLGHWFELRPGRHQRGAQPGDLPPFFANLLPEGDLGLILRDRLGVGIADDLGLLTAVGEDLPGAVVVRAEIEEEDLPRAPLARSPAPSDTSEASLRFSLAGVQLKFSMIRSGNRFRFPGKDQRGDWIAKIALDDYAGLCVNEFVTMEWARRAGFDVPPCELRRLGDLTDVPHEGAPETPIFVIRRYDRDGARRIHQEDMMQVLGYPNRPSTRKYNDATYDQLTQLLIGIVGEPAFDEMLRRLVFVVASGNNDAHLKTGRSSTPMASPRRSRRFTTRPSPGSGRRSIVTWRSSSAAPSRSSRSRWAGSASSRAARARIQTAPPSSPRPRSRRSQTPGRCCAASSTCPTLTSALCASTGPPYPCSRRTRPRSADRERR